MSLAIFTISAILFLILTIWFVLFSLFSDFSYPNLNLNKFNKLLVLFPHPDDEALTCSGLIQEFSRAGKKVALYLFTMGERGNEGAHFDEKLKKIREKESKHVAQILGIAKHVMFDFGDGQLKAKSEKLKTEIIRIIEEEKPDLVVTYDLSGIYGHPDHIALTEVVKNIIVGTRLTDDPLPKLLFVSYPPAFYRFVKLPIHMADDKTVLQNRSVPTGKIFLGLNNINRIRALYAYKSQLFGFKKSAFIFPLWFTLSARLFEYYYEVN